MNRLHEIFPWLSMQTSNPLFPLPFLWTTFPFLETQQLFPNFFVCLFLGIREKVSYLPVCFWLILVKNNKHQFQPFSCKWHAVIFPYYLWLREASLGIKRRHLKVCWWTSRLIPCPGYMDIGHLYGTLTSLVIYPEVVQLHFKLHLCLDKNMSRNIQTLFPPWLQ